MTAAMHKRLIRLGLLAAAAVLSLSSVAAEAQVVKPLPGHAYIDPFANPGGSRTGPTWASTGS